MEDIGAGAPKDWGVYRDALLPSQRNVRPRAWERAPVPASVPRLQGQKIWKRAGLRTRSDDKENEAQVELNAGGKGSRKRARNGALQDNSEPKWMDMHCEKVGAADMPSEPMEEQHTLQHVPRKRTNMDRVITPRKPLQETTFNRQVSVDSTEPEPLKDQAPRRRKSLRKSTRFSIIPKRESISLAGENASLEQAPSMDMVSEISSFMTDDQTVSGQNVEATADTSLNGLSVNTEGTTSADSSAEEHHGPQDTGISVEGFARESLSEPNVDLVVENLEDDKLEPHSDTDIEKNTSVEEGPAVAAEALSPSQESDIERLPQLLDSEPPLAAATEYDSFVDVEQASSNIEDQIFMGDSIKPSIQQSTSELLQTLSPIKAEVIPIPEALAELTDGADAIESEAAEALSEVLQAPIFDVPQAIESIEKQDTISIATPKSKATPKKKKITGIPTMRKGTRRSTRTAPSSPVKTEPQTSVSKPAYELPSGRDGSIDPSSEARDQLDHGSKTSLPSEVTAAVVKAEVYAQIKDSTLATLDEQIQETNIESSVDSQPAITHTSEVPSSLVRATIAIDIGLEVPDPMSTHVEEYLEFTRVEPSCDKLCPVETPRTVEINLPEAYSLPGPLPAHVEDASKEDTAVLQDATIVGTTDSADASTADPTTSELVETISENAPLATYDNDETDMLRDFLTRVKADKAAKANTLTAKRKRSLPHSPLQIPLGNLGGTSPSPPKALNEFDVSLPDNGPVSSPTKRRKREASEQDENDTGSKSIRRSGRTRLPVLKSPVAAPSFIPVRRLGSGETTVTLQRNEEKELATLTRLNTKKNKMGAVSVPEVLLSKSVEKDDPASRQRQLKEDFNAKKLKARKPKAKTVEWALEIAQYQQATTLQTVDAEDAKDGKKKDKVIEESKASVRIRSKIALGMAVNGTPAPKRRTRER